MDHYERLAARYVFLKQDSKVISKRIKDLTEKRKKMNREAKALGDVLHEMRRYSVSTLFDHWSEDELDEMISKCMEKIK